MLVDISFWGWERMKAESAPTEANPHDIQEALANGLATCWFGRAVSVEEVLEHLSPTINQEGKSFVLGVSYYPSDEGIDKSHKMGYPIDEAIFYEREDTSFWTFHLLEVRKRKGKFPAEVSTEDTT